MTLTPVSYLPGRRGRRPVSLCAVPAAAASHPASGAVREITEGAARLADAWRLWNHTSQPGALHDVQRHLADLVLAAYTAACLIDPGATTGEPDPAA